MTRRSGEWDLLHRDGDPVPADAYDVNAIAGEMRQRSRDLNDVAETLRKLSNLEGWRGEAATTFADKADDVLDDLGKAEHRYAKVADALAAWAHDVDHARFRTGSALTHAVEAHREVQAHDLVVTSSPEPTPEQVQLQQSHDQKRQAAQSRLDQARTDLDNALHDLDEAARNAAHAIKEAADIWDDGFWGNVAGWVRSHADLIEIICKALEVIAAVIGAIILVLVLTIGAPFALIVAALAVAVLLLAGHTALVLADTGKASWSDVAWDVVNVALIGGGAGAAKLAENGLRSLLPLMAGRLGNLRNTSALSRLAGSNLTRVQNALRITNPANNLARWAQGIDDAARLEGAAFRQTVLDLEHLAPSRLRVALTMDVSLARMSQTVTRLRGMAPDLAELEQLGRISHLTLTAVGTTLGGNAILVGKDGPTAVNDVVEFAHWAQEHSPWQLHPTH